MSDLVEKLRNLQDHYAISGRLGAENTRVFGDAADMIERKDAEIAKLRAALRFADAKLNGWLDASHEDEARKAVRDALRNEQLTKETDR